MKANTEISIREGALDNLENFLISKGCDEIVRSDATLVYVSPSGVYCTTILLNDGRYLFVLDNHYVETYKDFAAFRKYWE